MATTRPGQLTPYLAFKDASKAISFYEAAFGAKERFRLTDPAGKIGHAELDIGQHVIMLADEYPDFGAMSAHTLGGSPVAFHLQVSSADAAVEKAVAAGATLTRPARDEFYGERTAQIVDPYGYRWMLGETIEHVSPEEMQRRWSAGLEE